MTRCCSVVFLRPYLFWCFFFPCLLFSSVLLLSFLRPCAALSRTVWCPRLLLPRQGLSRPVARIRLFFAASLLVFFPRLTARFFFRETRQKK